MEREPNSEAFADTEIGFICGEDIDAVLRGDESGIRAWAAGVLETALERVLKHGAEASGLLHFAVEVLWQYSGGEANGSEELPIQVWLTKEHARGRQWSEFADLARAFIADMDEMRSKSEVRRTEHTVANDDPPL